MRQINLLLIIILIIVASYALRTTVSGSDPGDEEIIGTRAGEIPATLVEPQDTADAAGSSQDQAAWDGEAQEILDQVDFDGLIGDSPILGDPDAPVTMIVWTDFQCSYCQEFHKDIFPQIKSNYIDTGKVRFVAKFFPMEEHMFAQVSAEAAECASLEGKFWEMYDKIFEEGIRAESELDVYADELGLGTEFRDCFGSNVMSGEVNREKRLGESLGFIGTPSFIINDKTVIGRSDYRTFERAIEAEYNKAVQAQES